MRFFPIPWRSHTRKTPGRTILELLELESRESPTSMLTGPGSVVNTAAITIATLAATRQPSGDASGSMHIEHPSITLQPLDAGRGQHIALQAQHHTAPVHGRGSHSTVEPNGPTQAHHESGVRDAVGSVIPDPLEHFQAPLAHGRVPHAVSFGESGGGGGGGGGSGGSGDGGGGGGGAPPAPAPDHGGGGPPAATSTHPGTSVHPSGGQVMHYNMVGGGGGNNDGLPHQTTPEDFRAAPQSLPAVPIAFTPNYGQAPTGLFQYAARSSGYDLLLNGSQAVINLANPTGGAPDQLTMAFAQANAAPNLIAGNPLDWHSNFYVGANAYTDVPAYGQVTVQNLYTGIDAVYYGSAAGDLEYDVDVAPAADPSQVRLQFTGAASMHSDKAGNLVLAFADGNSLVQPAPVAYQPNDTGGRDAVNSRFVLNEDGSVSFAIGAYDAARPLVIDPTLDFGSYLGSSGTDTAYGVAADSGGDVFIAGNTPDLSTSYQDAYVAKFASNGRDLKYITYLGGSAASNANGVAVDPAGNAVVVGTTSATNFPTSTGAVQTTGSSSGSGFVTRLNATGDALLYSTYFKDSVPEAVAVNALGHAYVTGVGQSGMTTTTGAYQTTMSGMEGAFVAKFSPDGTSLDYSTYVGGTGMMDSAWANGIAIDSTGNAYIAGDVSTGSFPTTTGAYQTSGGAGDAFVAKLNSGATALGYSTYLGNSNTEGLAVAVDNAGAAYVTGKTTASGFPTTTGAYQTSRDGTGDAYVTKLNAAGSALVYSTFLGGSSTEQGNGIAVEADGTVLVAGSTTSSDFPVLNALPGTGGSMATGGEAFLTDLNAAGTALGFSSYLGQNVLGATSTAAGVALDPAGYAYVAGVTNGNFVTTTGAYQTSYGGGASDAFVMKVDPSLDPPVITAISPESTSTTANGYISHSGNITLSGTAPASDTIELFLDTVPIGTTTSNSSGSWLFDYTATTLADGTYDFTAQTQATGGRTSLLSVAQLVSIDTTAPTVTVTVPSSTVTLAPIVTVQASDLVGIAASTTVTFDVDLNNDGSFTGLGETGYKTATLTNGFASIAVALSSAGTYRIRARVTDLAGNQGTSSVQTFTIGSVSSPWTLTDAVIRTSELAGGNPDLQLGDLQVSEPLDLDRSPGASQSLDPALIYNSSMVNVKPIVQATLITDNASSLPATFTATLTWNGTAQSPVTFSTTGFHAGDALTFAVQSTSAVTGVSADSWSLSVTITGHGTTTASGTAYVVAEDSSPFGAGWSFSNLNQLVTETAGILWVYGDGSTRLFAYGPGSTLVSPPEDNGTLTLNTGGSYTYSAADGSQIDFNSSGQQTDYIRPDGLTSMTYSYTSGLLTGLTALDGATATFSYTSGLLSQITVGSRNWYLTMSSGDMTALQFPDSNTVNFTYSSHRMTDASQGTIANHWAYNSAGLLTTLRWGNSSSPSTTTLASANGQGLATPVVGSPVATETDPLGNKTTSAMDDAGRLLSLRAPDGGLSKWTRDSAGRVSSYTDPLGNVTSYARDTLGYVVTETLADSHTIHNTYQTAFHALLTTTDENSHTTSFSYDSLGHLLTMTDAASEVSTFAYSTSTGTLTSYEDPTGRYTTYTYDSDLRVTSVTTQLGTTSYGYDTTTGEVAAIQDANSHTTTFTRDSMGRVAGMSTPDGYSESWSYSSAGLETSFTDKNGTVTATTYDADGRGLVASTSVGSGTTAAAVTDNTYDSAGQLVAQVDPIGNETKYTLNTMGDTVVTIDPLGHVSRTVYDLDGQVTDSFDNTGARTHYTYNSRGFNTGITDAMGNVATNTFDPAGNLTQTEDPLTHVTSYACDNVDRLSTITDALTNVATVAYAADSMVSSITDPRTYVTSATYNFSSKQISVTAAYGTSVAQTATAGLDSVGNVTSITDGLSHVTSYTLNAVNDVTSIEDPLTHVTTIARDGMGNVTAVTDANSHTTSYTLNALGETTQVTDATSRTTQYVLNADGWTVATIDGAGDTSYALFDQTGDWGVGTDPNGSQTREEFDAAGRILAYTDPDGNTTMWQYDRNGNMTKQVDPNGSTVTQTYNADNQVTARTDELGRSETFSYDAVGQLTTELWKDSSGTTVNTITYTYNANGQILTAADNSGTYTLTYDALDRLSTQTDIWGLTLTFAYDGANNVTGVTDSLGGTVTNSYNAANYLTETQFTDSSSHALSIGYSYDNAGQLTTLSRYSDATETTLIGTSTYTYDNAGRVTGITHKNGGGTTLDSYSYTFDSAGRLATESGSLEPSATYSYDANSQLLGDGTHTFSFDPNGNRNYGSYATTTGNELTTDGTWNYSYDNAGNMTQKTNTSTGEVWLYYYDNVNHLVEADHNPSSGGSVDYKIQFTYDVFGNRIAQSVYPSGSGTPTVTHFAYDPSGNCWADLTSGGTLITRRLYDSVEDGLLARVESSGVDWYLKDQLNSVRDIVGSSGSLLDHRDYGVWGAIAYDSAPSYGDRYGWAGAELDSGTGLIHELWRYIDPSTGRWTTQDPIGFAAGDSNLYRYVKNSPSGFVDPSGTTMANAGGGEQGGDAIVQMTLGEPTAADIAAGLHRAPMLPGARNFTWYNPLSWPSSAWGDFFGTMWGNWQDGVNDLAYLRTGERLGGRAVQSYERYYGEPFAGGTQWGSVMGYIIGDIVGTNGIVEGLSGYDIATLDQISLGERLQRFVFGAIQLAGWAATAWAAGSAAGRIFGGAGAAEADGAGTGTAAARGAARANGAIEPGAEVGPAQAAGGTPVRPPANPTPRPPGAAGRPRGPYTPAETGEPPPGVRAPTGDPLPTDPAHSPWMEGGGPGENPWTEVPRVPTPDGGSTIYTSPSEWAAQYPGHPYPYRSFEPFFRGGPRPPWKRPGWQPPSGLNPPPEG
jgi:RHS repeat-associated protein